MMLRTVASEEDKEKLVDSSAGGWREGFLKT
jgi:hypothetical protein